MADRELDQGKVDTLIGSARSLRIADPVGPVDPEAQGFGEAPVTFRLRWTAAAPGGEAGQAEDETTVQIGDQVEDKETQRYITRTGFGFAGTIWESSVNALLEQKLDDLLAS